VSNLPQAVFDLKYILHKTEMSTKIEYNFNFSKGAFMLDFAGYRYADGVLRRAFCSFMAGASIAALSGCFTTAAAQETASSGSQIETVVVTAQKRDESLLSVAGSVTALTAAQLAKTQSVDLADYAALTPGLDLISQREGQTQLVLRGITTGSSTPNTTVAIYEDETPYGSSTAFASGNLLTLDLDPSDLQRIEVLSGPQGTLYGASSLGGVLKYVTTPPNLEDYSARAEIDGTTVDGGGSGYGLRAMVNVPIESDTLGLRVSGFDRLDPGYIDNPQLGRSNVNDSRVYGGRASLLWQPTDKLSVRLNVQYQKLNSGGASEEDVDGTTLKPLYGDLIQKRYSAEPLDVRYWLSSAVVNYDFGWAKLVSATSYSTLHESLYNDLTTTYQPVLGPALGIPDIGISFDIPVQQQKVTEEVRLTSPSDQKLEWQAGFFFTHEQSTHGEIFDPFETSTGASIPVNLLTGALKDRYTEYAGYADLDYHFTDKFDLMAGGRYGSNEQHYSQPESGALIGPATTLTAKSSDDSATFLVSPRYRLDDDNMVYARVASGYRPGGPNAVTPTEIAGGVPTSYGPDTLTDYEVGYKADLLQHRLTMDLSAFYIDWRNIQIQTVFNGFDATGNGGKAKSQGAQLSASYIPLDGLTLSGNLAYTDAELTQDALAVNAVSGDRLPSVPKLSAYFSADYDFEIAPSWGAFVGGDVRYTGDRPSDFVSGTPPAGFERPTMPDYTTYGLRAGFTHDAWDLELYVKNLGNVRGIDSLRSLAFGGFSDPYAASIIQPRTVGISLSAKY
jgi:iron complex outermembrane receptor protein